MRALKAGLVAFAIVFAAGFALGTLRVLIIAPRFGEVGAVLLELPVMLALSYAAWRWTISRLAPAPGTAERLTMGAVAFGCLMLAELAVSILAFGRSPAEHLETYRETRALLGLAAQVVFGLMPLAVSRADRERS